MMSQSESHLDFPLPPDTLHDILLLLPFKSILACKRVSKKCKNLINDPDFSRKYNLKGSIILTIHEDNLYCMLIRHSNTTNDGFPSHTTHRLPIMLQGSGKHELLSGQSNGGVVCVKASNGYFHLYNLFTGVLHTLETRHSQTWLYYGFGYDCYDDDHKIMVVCDYMNKKTRFQNKKNTLFWVYSSKTSRWKRYDGFPYTQYTWVFPGRFYFFNGALHSLATNKSSGDSVIVTCDLHTYKFGEISVPDSYRRNCRVAFLTEVKGRQCFTYRLGYQLDMEVYGDRGYWVKCASITDPNERMNRFFSNWLVHTELCESYVVCIWGQILVVRSWILESYMIFVWLKNQRETCKEDN